MELRADLPDCPARLVADVESDFIIGNAMADVDIDIYGSLRVTRYSSLIFNDLSRKAQTLFNFFRCIAAWSYFAIFCRKEVIG